MFFGYLQNCVSEAGRLQAVSDAVVLRLLHLAYTTRPVRSRPSAHPNFKTLATKNKKPSALKKASSDGGRR